jgi:hypothetical protein
MSDVQFEEDFNTRQPTVGGQGGFVNPYVQKQAGGIIGWMIEKGIIKEESQAKGILLGVVVFNIVVTLFVVFYFL